MQKNKHFISLQLFSSNMNCFPNKAEKLSMKIAQNQKVNVT